MTAVVRFSIFSVWSLVLLNLLTEHGYAKIKVVRMVQVKEYVGCKIKLPFHQEGVTVNVTGRGLITLNGHLVIDEDVGNLTQILASLEKCKSHADRGSCEYYTSTSFDNPCALAVARGMVWTPIFDKIHPRITCPIRKGTYYTEDSTFDASLVAKLIKPGEYWRITVKLMVQKRLVSCYKFGIELVELRVSSKT